MSRLSRERKISKDRLFEICSKNPNWTGLPDETKQTHIRRIERGIHNMTVEFGIHDGIELRFQNKMFVDRYSVIFSKIAANLADNPAIIEGLISGEIDSANLAAMNSQELNPQANKDIRDMILKRQNQKLQIKVTRDYECKKCHAYEATCHYFQGRGADEPENVGFECIKCHHTWVF